MTASGSLAYRVVPKCACSTIGQALYHLDNGGWYDGDVHDAEAGLHKWAFEDSRQAIAEAVLSGRIPVFTCVRNPFARVLSAFFDKICGIQRNGRRYRGNLVPVLAHKYGVDVEEGFDQIAAFRRFLLFARDTVRFRKPMEPDIHWSSASGHVSTLIAGGGRYDAIIATEDLTDGLARILRDVPAAHPVDPAAMPRFNEAAGHGPARAHPVADFFDDLAVHLVYEMYHRDFELFRYDRADPGRQAPLGEIDLDEVHAVLG